MSVSAIFGTRLVAIPNPTTTTTTTPSSRFGNCGATIAKPAQHGLVIECSSRPQKKGTKHHMKTRPKKTQPWDKNRRPTVYAPLPPLPPDWTPVSASDNAETSDAAAAAETPEPLIIE